MLGRPLPFAYSRRFTTAETPPYAQPTTRTRCGDDSERLPIVSVMLAIFILKNSGVVKMRGRIGRWWWWWEVEDDLIRLTRTGGHWRFIDIHTSHRYRRRPALDWDRRHALAQSHHTGGGLEASLVRYVEDRVILIRSAANFIRSAASMHWRAQSIGQRSMHLGFEPFLASLIEASWSMHLLLADAGHLFGSRSAS
jgi:hypothetical protein